MLDLIKTLCVNYLALTIAISAFPIMLKKPKMAIKLFRALWHPLAALLLTILEIISYKVIPKLAEHAIFMVKKSYKLTKKRISKIPQ